MDVVSIISVIVTSLLGGGVGFLFYRQEKAKKEIDNESQRSEEWRKLYEESKADSKEKEYQLKERDMRIEELIEEKNRWKNECVVKDNEITRLKFYKCVKLKCFERMPPFLLQEGEEAIEEQ